MSLMTNYSEQIIIRKLLINQNAGTKFKFKLLKKAEFRAWPKGMLK